MLHNSGTGPWAPVTLGYWGGAVVIHVMGGGVDQKDLTHLGYPGRMTYHLPNTVLERLLLVVVDPRLARYVMITIMMVAGGQIGRTTGSRTTQDGETWTTQMQFDSFGTKLFYPQNAKRLGSNHNWRRILKLIFRAFQNECRQGWKIRNQV